MHIICKNAYIFIAMILFELIINMNSIYAEKVGVDWNETQKIPVFCYHDVVDNNNTKALEKDPFAITEKRLDEHFNLLKKEGFTPISIKQYEDYINGIGNLPDKPVLLSFDDGRESMYTNIYPLLKKYN